MRLSNIKAFIVKSTFGKVLGGTYLIYLSILMFSSAQLGVQLGNELKSVPANDRMAYISTFLSKNLSQ